MSQKNLNQINRYLAKIQVLDLVVSKRICNFVADTKSK